MATFALQQGGRMPAAGAMPAASRVCIAPQRGLARLGFTHSVSGTALLPNARRSVARMAHGARAAECSLAQVWWGACSLACFDVWATAKRL